MYTVTNFKTKKQLKEAVALRDIPVYQPNIGTIEDGTGSVKGPHYPEPHQWYAAVTIKNGVIPKGSRIR